MSKGRNRVAYSTRLDANLRDRLVQLSKDTMIPQTKLLDLAIKDLLDKMEKKMKQDKG